MLVVDNLVSYYANIKILNEISFNLNQGQVLCLSGEMVLVKQLFSNQLWVW